MEGGWVGKVRQWWKATKTTELWNAMWPEDPLHTQTHTPSRVLKKTFSASFVPQPAENHTYNSIILRLIIPQQTFQPFGVCKIQIFFLITDESWEGWRAEPLGEFNGDVPQKNLKSWCSEKSFLRFWEDNFCLDSHFMLNFISIVEHSST